MPAYFTILVALSDLVPAVGKGVVPTVESPMVNSLPAERVIVPVTVIVGRNVTPDVVSELLIVKLPEKVVLFPLKRMGIDP